MARAQQVVVTAGDVFKTEELHQRLMTALAFPGFYGRNGDAFWDAITGLVEMPHTLRLEGWQALEGTPPSRCPRAAAVPGTHAAAVPGTGSPGGVRVTRLTRGRQSAWMGCSGRLKPAQWPMLRRQRGDRRLPRLRRQAITGWGAASTRRSGDGGEQASLLSARSSL